MPRAGSKHSGCCELESQGGMRHENPVGTRGAERAGARLGPRLPDLCLGIVHTGSRG